jgi:hypothetical protein
VAPYEKRFFKWVGISLVVHAILIAIPMRQRTNETLSSVSQGPLTVEIIQAPPATAEEVAPKPAPRIEPEAVKRPVVPPRPVVREPPKLAEPVARPAPEPLPTPEPAPPRPEPPVDMMAAINARREARRQAEAAAARGPHAPSDEELAQANINRNLQFTPGGGVSGIFEILSKGTRTAEFAFNGWRPNSDRHWREVIEVDAGLGGDIDLAIVRRMIALIRTHYDGDFYWESRRLGRIVRLSARQEDNDGLEDFLMKEFFGTPTLRSRH